MVLTCGQGLRSVNPSWLYRTEHSGFAISLLRCGQKERGVRPKSCFQSNIRNGARIFLNMPLHEPLLGWVGLFFEPIEYKKCDGIPLLWLCYMVKVRMLLLWLVAHYLCTYMMTPPRLILLSCWAWRSKLLCCELACGNGHMQGTVGNHKGQELQASRSKELNSANNHNHISLEDKPHLRWDSSSANTLIVA